MDKSHDKTDFCEVIRNKDVKYLKEFGKNLRKLRLDKNITQEALATDALIGKNQIGLIERGEINVTISTLKKIAEQIGIHPKDLLNF